MISIAPMLKLTNRHCRYFFRLLTKHALLYTEMTPTRAILRNKLPYNDIEHPVALQLGGCDPKELAACAKIGEDAGYDEINLNVGCPSERVQVGKFGACLMLEPELVAKCVAAMQKNIKIPVTVKTRLGIDDHDSYAELGKFIKLVNCEKFIIHARKAYLKKSPKENRKTPKLNYQMVHQLKKDFPKIKFILNGGLCEYSQIKQQLKHVDGIMIGRKAYRDPYFLANIDQEFYGKTEAPKTRTEIIAAFMTYVESQLSAGENLSHLTKPLQGLFHGVSGAKEWRSFISSYCRISA